MFMWYHVRKNDLKITALKLCLLRNTNDYAKLLQRLYSVKVLASEEYRDERVKSLKAAMTGSAGEQEREKQSAVAEEEIGSLLRGDVPIFHCIAHSKDLYSGEKLIVRDYFSKSIKENVRCRIENLTERECEFELGIIHQSLRCAHILQDAPSFKAARKESALSFKKEVGKAFDEIWEQRLICPSGKAGWLYILCTNEELQAVPHYKEYVISLCDRIISMQTLNTPQEISTWDTLGKKRPISGLGHGIAGIGLALASAYRLFPSEKLRLAIQSAFETERTLYSHKLGTWCDYRDTSAPASAMNGFCSGAPGMGSVYLKLHAWGITDFDDDLEKAISKVISTKIMPRDHYCCGNSSSVEFLLDAGRELDRPELTQDALRRLNEVTKCKAARGEYTFLPEQYENYSPLGLLNGLSGVGHLLLKADNSSMNCLLL